MLKRIDAVYCNHMNTSAVYLITAKSGETALIDTGTPGHYDNLLKHLDKKTLSTIIVTHGHLDHSGNTRLLARDFPDARIYAHPNCIQEIINPTTIRRRMKKVMKNRFDFEFNGMMVPINEKRLTEVKEGSKINFDSGLMILETPGHSYDHISIKWNDEIFTGDAFGVHYHEISQIVLPSNPPDFDPDSSLQSLSKIEHSGAKIAHIAHFGEITDMHKAADQCRIWTRFMKNLVESGIPLPEMQKELEKKYKITFGNDLFYRQSRIRNHCNVNCRGLATLYKKYHQ